MKNTDSSSSYRSILKGTSIFGGVQIFNILINLVRGKFVAVILGPEGMGITSLFNSAMNLIQRFSSFGLNQSIVRETAVASESSETLSHITTGSRYILNISALLGLLICVAFCLPLSEITFGTRSYWWQFMILGAAIWFGILANGKLAILQGLHQVKKISYASIIGGLTGLCVGVPLYYIFGDKGIVPAIVALTLSLYLFYSINLKKILPKPVERFSWTEVWPHIKILLSLGIVLMASDLIGSLVIYLLNLFVRWLGGIDDVGLFQAANSVTNQYAGLVFAAMAMDYYPRLSKVAADNRQMATVVNRQTEIVSFLITPAMCLLIISAPLVIRILLSENFFAITPLMRWMGLGILFKALSFPMGYIAFAKGNKKVFLILEGIVGNLLYLSLGCLGYYFFGLIGLGYALVIENFIVILIYYIVNNRLYGYTLTQGALGCLVWGIVIGILCFGSSLFDSDALAYTFMGVITALSLIFSFFQLKKYFNQG